MSLSPKEVETRCGIAADTTGGSEACLDFPQAVPHIILCPLGNHPGGALTKRPNSGAQLLPGPKALSSALAAKASLVAWPAFS